MKKTNNTTTAVTVSSEVVFKNIPSYGGDYMASTDGDIMSNKRGKESKVLKPRLLTNGYLYVNLSNDGEVKMRSVHSLVAETFLNKEQSGFDYSNDGFTSVVDHIGGSETKTDNRVENLQLISQRQNTLRSKVGKSSMYPGVSIVSKTGNYLAQTRIQYNGFSIKVNLGTYTDEKLAAKVYEVSVRLHGMYEGDSKAFRDAAYSLALRTLKINKLQPTTK